MQYDSRLIRLLVAILAAGGALLLRFVAEPLGGASAVWLCLLLGVTLSAWYGGLKPGLVTTALLLASVFLLARQESAEVSAAVQTSLAGEASPVPSPAVSAFFFLLTAAAICTAMQRLRMEHFRAQATGSRLRDVLESTQDAIVSIDGEFRCLYANARAGQLARKPAAMLLGKSLRTVFPEAPGIIVYKELARALRERGSAHFEDKNELNHRWYRFDAYAAPAGLNLFIREIPAIRTTAGSGEADADEMAQDADPASAQAID